MFLTCWGLYSSGNKAEEFTGSVGFLRWDRCVLGLIAFSCHSVFSLSDTSSSSESSPRADSVNREMCWHAAHPAGRSLQRKKNVSVISWSTACTHIWGGGRWRGREGFRFWLESWYLIGCWRGVKQHEGLEEKNNREKQEQRGRRAGWETNML